MRLLKTAERLEVTFTQRRSPEPRNPVVRIALMLFSTKILCCYLAQKGSAHVVDRVKGFDQA